VRGARSEGHGRCKLSQPGAEYHATQVRVGAAAAHLGHVSSAGRRTSMDRVHALVPAGASEHMGRHAAAFAAGAATTREHCGVDTARLTFHAQRACTYKTVATLFTGRRAFATRVLHATRASAELQRQLGSAPNGGELSPARPLDRADGCVENGCGASAHTRGLAGG